ncbi:hypothetical protein FHR76_005113 [Rhizobium sp. RAS22]|nr:hypothetical protein [Rhizobium sp. RAS22]
MTLRLTLAERMRTQMSDAGSSFRDDDRRLDCVVADSFKLTAVDGPLVRRLIA